MKKVLKIVLSIVACIPFVFIWYIGLIVFALLYTEGTLSVIDDAFGQTVFYIWTAFGILAFFSIIYLRLFIKKQWLVHVIAYALTAVFALSGFGLVKAGESKFSKFTPELWQEYPAQRGIMYYDLDENYEIEGLSEAEITELLGEPDYKYSESETYEYHTGYNTFIYISFKDGIANDIMTDEIF